jgi:hypothetical protein
MRYVIRNAMNGMYRNSQGVWIPELDEAQIYKDRRHEKSYWFADHHQLVPVTVTVTLEETV